jgi:hypothetical protein
MFQGDDNHTKTPATSPASVAVSTLSPKPKYSVTRSQVMKRAWQLAKLNRGNVNNTGRESLGQYMRMAWDEARRGETENWAFLSPEHEARCLERQLVTLQHDDRRTSAHYALMPSLRDSVRSLRAGIGGTL